MPAPSVLLERIGAVCLRAERGDTDVDVLDEMEALLAEGYAGALIAEGHSRQLGRTLERLAENPGGAEAAVQVRRIALRKRTVDHRVSVLRERLAVLREHYLR